MKKGLALAAVLMLGVFPAVSLAANPYTIMMDQRMKRAQHELDLARKQKGSEQEKLILQNLSIMKKNLRLMSENMAELDRRMAEMIRQFRSKHHRQMVEIMQSMTQEHQYVLKVMNQMVEGAELRNASLIKGDGK